MPFLVLMCGLPLAFRLPMVKDHLSSSVISVDVEDDLKTVAQLLSRNRITGAPVVEDGTVIGILSRNDLLRAICTVPTDASTQVKEDSLDEIRATKVWKVCQIAVRTRHRWAKAALPRAAQLCPALPCPALEGVPGHRQAAEHPA